LYGAIYNDKMEEPSITQKLIERKHHKPQRTTPCLTLEGEIKLFLRLLLTFERNYEAELMKADPEGYIHAHTECPRMHSSSAESQDTASTNSSSCSTCAEWVFPPPS
jgi:hypothetical protein